MQDNSNNRWAELVAKLIALTQDGVLHWSKSEKQLSQNVAINFIKVESYIASHKGKKIILTAPIKAIGAKQFKLEIAGEDGISLFEIPTTSGIQDLYDAIRYSASGVKQYIDDLLGEG